MLNVRYTVLDVFFVQTSRGVKIWHAWHTKEVVGNDDYYHLGSWHFGGSRWGPHRATYHGFVASLLHGLECGPTWKSIGKHKGDILKSVFLNDFCCKLNSKGPKWSTSKPGWGLRTSEILKLQQWVSQSATKGRPRAARAAKDSTRVGNCVHISIQHSVVLPKWSSWLIVPTLSNSKATPFLDCYDWASHW